MKWNVVVEAAKAGAMLEIEADTKEQAEELALQQANAGEHTTEFTVKSATPAE